MTLTKNEILRRLRSSHESGLEPIVITPILDLEDQVGISSVDVRLGKQFVVFKEHITDTFSPVGTPFVKNNINKYQEEIVVPFKSCITLHPGKLIIGSTFEYVSIPSDLECQVEGRSSWARLGLLIATATTVEPFFKGVITLELSNTGTIPIQLFPGIKIAQLIFHKTSEIYAPTTEEFQKRKYSCAIGPGLSRVFRDKGLDYFCGNRPERNC